MKVSVNGVDVRPGRVVQNWGELLAQLDETCGAQGLLVTDVAFDGVDEPSFREPELASRAVASARIDVGAARQSDLLLSAVDDALRAIGPLREAAQALSGAFRAYDIDGGNRDLAAFAPNLGAFLALTGTIANVARLDLTSETGEASHTGTLADLSGNVEALIDARSGGDWVSVADLLENEIVAALDHWGARLAEVRLQLVPRSTSA